MAKEKQEQKLPQENSPDVIDVAAEDIDMAAERMDKLRVDLMEEERYAKDLARGYLMSPDTSGLNAFGDSGKPFDRRLEEARLDDIQQDTRFKKDIFNTLKIFLKIETIIIFSFALLQATGGIHIWKINFSFALDEWTFRIVVGATLAQITIMFNSIVANLFPAKKNKVER